MFSLKRWKGELEELMPRKVLLCDVGARWGIEEPWRSFSQYLQILSFEPDQEAYEALAQSKRVGDLVYPYALFSKEGNFALHLTKSRGSSSFLKPDLAFLGQFADADRFTIEDNILVPTTTLDRLHGQGEIKDVDFIKLDVQGAELDVLRGGKDFLKSHVLGLQVEVEFHPMYENQPLFADVDQFIRSELHLSLHDLRKSYWKYPEGRGVGGTKGKLIFGDALYLRDPHELLDWCKSLGYPAASEKIIMGCVVGLSYGYIDYVLCLLNLPELSEFLDDDVVHRLKRVTLLWGKSFKYEGWGAGKLAMAFDLLYRLVQPTHQGWASVGHHLGSRKTFGIFH